ncbi:flagellar biosynthesis anti-sigma factor FlgM [Niallia oryzisoli]|uniref:Negative regulator of flagellin synthesis n=1 Tax=Niallia oryzisoli TaxID=1737571 RepID=A0ABZ2CA43_9BACI
MKINNFRPQGVNPYKNQMNKLDNIEKAASKKRDVVEISSEAKELQQVSSYELERQKKVDDLKLQIENGTYKPQPKEIAKSIINYYSK